MRANDTIKDFLFCVIFQRKDSDRRTLQSRSMTYRIITDESVTILFIAARESATSVVLEIY